MVEDLGIRMLLGSSLNGIIPKPAGREVRTLELNVSVAKPANNPSLEILKTFGEWFTGELHAIVAPDFFETSQVGELLSSSGKKYLTLHSTLQSGDDLVVRELQVSNTFSFGIETTRIRLIEQANSVALEITSFIKIKTFTRSVFDVPRVGDSLALALERNGSLKVKSENISLASSPFKVNMIRERPPQLVKLLAQNRLPVAMLLDTKENAMIASKLARESFGMAFIVLMKTDDLAVAKQRPAAVNTLIVEWKESIIGQSKYSLDSQVTLFLRDLRIHNSRNNTFDLAWRDALAFFKYAPKKDSHEVASSQEIATLISDKQKALLSLQEARQELANYIDEFDGERRAWQEERESQRKLTYKYNQSIFRELRDDPREAKKIAINVDLSARDLDSMFAEVSIATNGALVFTDRVAKSWLEAEKRGYSDKAKMEHSLVALAQFALAFHATKGGFGMGLKEYAKNEFGLELVLDDNLQEMAHPVFEYEGVRYSQEKHIRANESKESKDKLGRIHFAMDEKKYRIIVNHVGRKLWENDK